MSRRIKSSAEASTVESLDLMLMLDMLLYCFEVFEAVVMEVVVCVNYLIV